MDAPAYCKKKYFGGPGDPLSNYHVFDMEFQGFTLLSLEHHYHHQKLLHHMHLNHLQLHQHIHDVMHAPTPHACRQLALRHIPEECLSREWLQHRTPLMHRLLAAKYQQCAEFRDALAHHGVFCEDTNHPFFARGKHNHGLNVLGSCLNRLRDKTTPHLIIIGDSHLRSLPHHVQDTVSLPPPARPNAFTEVGRILYNDTYVLTSVVCCPGIRSQQLYALVKNIPFVVKDATHIAILVGTNDLSCTPPLYPTEIQKTTQRLHNLMLSVNPYVKVLDVSIPPRFDSYNTQVMELNNIKSQDADICVPTNLSRRNFPISSCYDRQCPFNLHLNPKGKLKLFNAIVDKCHF